MSVSRNFESPANIEVATAEIRSALAHMYPRSDVWIIGPGDIKVQDVAGHDWTICIHAPQDFVSWAGK